MGQNRMNDVLVIQCMASQFSADRARDRPRGCMRARIHESEGISDSGFSEIPILHDSGKRQHRRMSVKADGNFAARANARERDKVAEEAFERAMDTSC